jgi:hypothetical protein
MVSEGREMSSAARGPLCVVPECGRAASVEVERRIAEHITIYPLRSTGERSGTLLMQYDHPRTVVQYYCTQHLGDI